VKFQKLSLIRQTGRGDKMQILPVILRKNGFDYSQVLRDEKKAIYCQHVTPNLEYFEVFKIQTHLERVFKGGTIPAGESFPSNEGFGVTAWTYRTLEKAMVKYNTLP